MRGALTAYAWLTQAENRAFEPKEARAMLSDVRAARGSRRARTSQSEEVRIAARALEAALEP